MSLACSEAIDYLVRHSRPRRIATSDARSLPGMTADELLQMASLRLTVTLQRRCPHWPGCPARGGRAPECRLGEPGDDGRRYVDQVLRRTIIRARGVGKVWSGHRRLDALDGDDAKQGWLASTAPGPPDVVAAGRWREQLRSDQRRLATEDPAAVWPGAGPLRLPTKVAAAELVLGLQAATAGEALRMVDPGHYGALGAPVSGVQATRTNRDGAQVLSICRAVWQRVKDD